MFQGNLEDHADALKHVGVLTIYKILLIYVCRAFVCLENKLYRLLSFFRYQDFTILATKTPVLVLAAQVILLSESPNNFLCYMITFFQPHILEHEVRRRHC